MSESPDLACARFIEKLGQSHGLADEVLQVLALQRQDVHCHRARIDLRLPEVDCIGEQLSTGPSTGGSCAASLTKYDSAFIDRKTCTSLPLTAPTEATIAAICSRSRLPETTITLIRFDMLVPSVRRGAQAATGSRIMEVPVRRRQQVHRCPLLHGRSTAPETDACQAILRPLAQAKLRQIKKSTASRRAASGATAARLRPRRRAAAPSPKTAC